MEVATREELQRDLTRAIAERDAIATAALRSLLAAFANAEAIPTPTTFHPQSTSANIAGSLVGVGAAEAPRHILTEAERHRIISGEVDDRLSAAEQYEASGHSDGAMRLRAEAEVLKRYLA